nr:hypothetical protein RVX_1103 [Nitratidesulfovibrio sp. HK-II]
MLACPSHVGPMSVPCRPRATCNRATCPRPLPTRCPGFRHPAPCVPLSAGEASHRARSPLRRHPSTIKNGQDLQTALPRRPPQARHALPGTPALRLATNWNHIT